MNKDLKQLIKDADTKMMRVVCTKYNEYEYEKMPPNFKGIMRIVELGRGELVMNNNKRYCVITKYDNNLIEYTGDKIIIYAHGKRDLTEDERRAQYDISNITKNEFKYTDLEEYIKENEAGQIILGKWDADFTEMYDKSTDKVITNKIRGEIEEEYQVIKQ